MYTTELWVFAGGLTKRGGHAPFCSIVRGYFVCIRYHLGTMVIGGVVVGCVQPIRLSFALLAGLVQFDRNSVGIVSSLCDCMVSVYRNHLEPWCRNAYMDVALNSRSFYESAWHVSWVNAKFMSAVNILNGATSLFQLAGLGAITSMGHLQTCVIIKYYPGFEDPYSPDYVQNPFLLGIFGAGVAFTMAFPFMMLFDTVSDTVLFAYIVQKMREEKIKVPTMYSRACGFVERMDDLLGLGCVDHDYKERYLEGS